MNQPSTGALPHPATVPTPIDREKFLRFRKLPHHAQSCVGGARMHIENALKEIEQVATPVCHNGVEAIQIAAIDPKRAVVVVRQLVSALRVLERYSGVPVKPERIRWMQ